MSENWINTLRAVVYPSHCDAMGHLTIKEYMGFFDQAEWHCFAAIGFDPAWIEDRSMGWADVHHEVDYKGELLAGALVIGESRVLRIGAKSLTTGHRLLNATTGKICATLQAVTVQYDLAQRCAIPLAEEVRAAATRLLGEDQRDGGQ
ncbi:acyl-CoA thioesterase [Rhodospirillum sp. A1_3_36]|uniref:acyl-CoA thioesterase n=1 Tax=Rhodospirillum sp. A1_3_36 TaxID=3391666 RepID=UPI0039A412EF